MAGRPRGELTPHQVLDVHRLSKNMGQRAIAARLGLPPNSKAVRRELEALRVRRKPSREWCDDEDSLLREHAGERSKRRLVRDLRAMGYQRSERAVGERIVLLMQLGIRELRLELTIVQASVLIGRSDKFVTDELGRRRLRGHEQDGAWRIWPSALRNYVLADLDRADWMRCERRELIDLLLRRWGVSDEERRSKRQGARV